MGPVSRTIKSPWWMRLVGAMPRAKTGKPPKRPKRRLTRGSYWLVELTTIALVVLICLGPMFAGVWHLLDLLLPHHWPLNLLNFAVAIPLSVYLLRAARALARWCFNTLGWLRYQPDDEDDEDDRSAVA